MPFTFSTIRWFTILPFFSSYTEIDKEYKFTQLAVSPVLGKEHGANLPLGFFERPLTPLCRCVCLSCFRRRRDLLSP